MVDLTGVCYLPMRQISGCRFGCMFLGQLFELISLSGSAALYRSYTRSLISKG